MNFTKRLHASQTNVLSAVDMGQLELVENQNIINLVMDFMRTPGFKISSLEAEGYNDDGEAGVSFGFSGKEKGDLAGYNKVLTEINVKAMLQFMTSVRSKKLKIELYVSEKSELSFIIGGKAD